MKTSGLTRFLALCLAVISLSMLVAGGLGIRAANKDRRKDESELQDLRSRIDEYREISAALMDRTSYEQLNKTLEEKQKQYDADTAKHRADLSTYTVTNSGLEMGTAALNQAESALETGKTQYETGRKALRASLNAFNQIYSYIEPIQAQSETIRAILFRAEMMLRGEEADSGNPYDGSVYKLEQTVRNLCALIENDLPETPAPAPETPAPAPETPAPAPETPAPAPETPAPAPETPAPVPETPTPVPETPTQETLPPETSTQETLPPETSTQETPTPVPETPASVPETPTPALETTTPAPEAPPQGNPESPGEPTLETNSVESSGDLPPAPENADAPRSPATGEEKDLSGRLNDAIRDVVFAAEVVAEDINTITALAESLQLPPEILQTVLNSAGVLNEDELRKSIITAIHESGIVITEEQGNALGQMLDGLSNADELMHTMTAQIQQLTKAAETVEGEADAMTEYLLAGLGNAGIASGDHDFTENEMAVIRSLYLANKDVIGETLDTAGENRQQAYGTVLHAESSSERIFGLIGQLAGAKATLDQTLEAMKEMGEQIEEGEAALAEGKAQLSAAKEEQKKKAEELDKKKKDLDQQEKALKQSAQQAEEQKELEDREMTLRTALLSREEIRRRSQYGMDLLSASEHWLTEYTEQTQERYRDRFDASLLMIVCAILAVSGALASFGGNRVPLLTLLSTLLCLAFSISAALLLYRMGRGISWSAAVTAVIAAAELIFLIPTIPVFGGMGAPAAPERKTVRKTGTKTAENPDQKKK